MFEFHYPYPNYVPPDVGAAYNTSSDGGSLVGEVQSNAESWVNVEPVTQPTNFIFPSSIYDQDLTGFRQDCYTDDLCFLTSCSIPMNYMDTKKEDYN